MESMNDPCFLPVEQLEQLGAGLTVAIIHNALAYGEGAANSCTANDPPILSGFLRWGRTVRGLRDQLAVHGWRRGDLLGMPTVVSPDGKVAIAVATGNDGTGTNNEAKTKYRKGAAAASAIEANQLMFDCIGFGPNNDGKVDIMPTDCVTWYLLFVKIGEEIRAELSLPSNLGTDGRVEGFTSRYRMPVLNLNESPPPLASDEPDVIVDVIRR